jgi:hypothetical protein
MIHGVEMTIQVQEWLRIVGSQPNLWMAWMIVEYGHFETGARGYVL